ncbi:hypothetical protein [Microbacterium sp. UBA3486]|uniref:hypothetical protein n=1 Tax=Microbacterium TaxID=33882 RepID=UPI0025DD8D97|nr:MULTISPECIES: hypothetical protein [Microbacterium]
MTFSDALAVWGLTVTSAGLIVTVVGFWVAIVQLKKTATATKATTTAVETANRRMLYNHLLVLMPQLRGLEGDIDASVVAGDKAAAVRALVAFSHAANQVAALLDTEPRNDGVGEHAELIGELRAAARAVSAAKGELVSGTKKSLGTLLHGVSGQISDVASRCAGLSTTYQTNVAV